MTYRITIALDQFAPALVSALFARCENAAPINAPNAAPALMVKAIAAMTNITMLRMVGG
jgi:hypothetical protein